MSRMLALACALAAFTLAAGAAFVPTSAQSATPPYGSAITLDDAKRAMAAAELEAGKNSWQVAITIIDSGGNLVMFHKFDNTQLASIGASEGKARTALTFKRPSKALDDAIAAGGAGLRLLAVKDITPLEGGLPIIIDGKIIGAIGVSGALSSQDAQVAKAGIDALRNSQLPAADRAGIAKSLIGPQHNPDAAPACDWLAGCRRPVTCMMIVDRATLSRMQRKSLGGMSCPIARSLERVGEWWRILIMRDALHGYTRFDQFPEEPRHRSEYADATSRRAGRGGAVRAPALQRASAARRVRADVARPRLSAGDGRAARLGQQALRAGRASACCCVDARSGNAADPIMVDRATGET